MADVARLPVALRGLLDAAALVRTGLVDVDYYAAQTGARPVGRLSAARHYLASGEVEGLSLHPLFEPESVGRRGRGARSVLLRYLTDPTLRSAASPHPVWAGPVPSGGAPAVAPGDAWLAWARSTTPESTVPVRPGSRAVTWAELRSGIVHAAREWRSGAPEGVVDWAEAAHGRTPGLTSVVVPVSGGLRDLERHLALVEQNRGDLEIVFVGAASRAQACVLAAVAMVRTQVTFVPDPGRPLAVLWNRGAAASRGVRLVFVAPWASPAPGAVSLLADALERAGAPIAQPLNEAPDMTIRSAGAYFPPGDMVPWPALAGHPTRDAVAGEATRVVPAALSAVLAVDAGAFFSLRGFSADLANDFIETDLSLRAASTGGRTVLVPAARVTVSEPDAARWPEGAGRSADLLRRRHAAAPGPGDLFSAAGFTVSGHRDVLLGAGAVPRRAPELAREQLAGTVPPRLRWTIDTSVTAGWWAGAWGDWHFARSLAGALERRGQRVAVDTRSARGRESRRFDDVLLTLRGIERVRPGSAPVNLLWVIYNPDDVTADECAEYQQVFAASSSWAEARSSDWGRSIAPLLQCTDVGTFRPEPQLEPQLPGRVVFVGNARRGARRPIVEAALEAGVPLELYGTGWDAVPAAAGRVVARTIANEDVGRLYARSAVVLNDHREDMRRAGFVSNRLFDAVASGARVLSDSVADAGELFGPSVRCCEPEDVAALLHEPLDTAWPGGAERGVIAERVREEHSFDHRAGVLLQRAIELLGGT